jgi:hypothetical protein
MAKRCEADDYIGKNTVDVDELQQSDDRFQRRRSRNSTQNRL